AELGTELVGLFVVQGDEALLTAGAGWADGQVGRAREPLAGTLLGRALADGEPLVRAEIAPDDLGGSPLLRDLGLRALIAAPVQSGQRPRALLLAGSAAPREWSPQEVAFLTALAHILAAARGVPAAPAQAALYDPLTHLPNRPLLLDHLARALARAARREALTGVVILSLAADAGEPDASLLGAAAERLRSALRPSDLLARTGHAEFALIVENAGQATAVVQIAERLVAVAEQAGARARAGVALGAAGRSADELLRGAAQARDWALAPGGPPVALDDPGLGAASLDEHQHGIELRRALAAGALDLRYEPIFAADDTLAALEVRPGWPVQGKQDARALWALAGRVELDGALTSWTLTSASRDALDWPALSATRLIVPAAPHLLAEPGAAEHLAELLAAAGLAPERLLLAVDEGALGDDRVLEQITALRRLGVGLLLDSFGLGRLAPARLAGLGAEVLRLDRSLTAGQLDPSVVAGLARLAHGLGARVAALDLDSAERCRHLRELGCDLVQGAAVAPPRTAAQLAGAPPRLGPER
ncbi:MAG TPA: EAL domain-containing protein, partial [Thermomicrobiaceae bacterium]|nr:EAL domain-containing protein [Thermomicrobiaceae bacterium]